MVRKQLYGIRFEPSFHVLLLGSIRLDLPATAIDEEFDAGDDTRIVRGEERESGRGDPLRRPELTEAGIGEYNVDWSARTLDGLVEPDRGPIGWRRPHEHR
jgi:hypothetical protein